jgi:hypothetical protein
MIDFAETYYNKEKKHHRSVILGPVLLGLCDVPCLIKMQGWRMPASLSLVEQICHPVS